MVKAAALIALAVLAGACAHEPRAADGAAADVTARLPEGTTETAVRWAVEATLVRGPYRIKAKEGNRYRVLISGQAGAVVVTLFYSPEAIVARPPRSLPIYERWCRILVSRIQQRAIARMQNSAPPVDEPETADDPAWEREPVPPASAGGE